MAPTKVLPASSESAAIEDHDGHCPPCLSIGVIMIDGERSPVNTVDAICGSRPFD